MPAIVVRATELSVFEVDAPHYGDIQAAFDAAVLRDGGTWAGPVRVVRTAHVGERFRTYAVGVYLWEPRTDTRPPTGDAAGRLAHSLSAELQRRETINGWQSIDVLPYAAAVNGPLSFWTSGQAAQTITRDTFPTGMMRVTEEAENPLGVTRPQDTPALALDRAVNAVHDTVRSEARAVQQAAPTGSTVKTLFELGVALAGIFLASKVLSK